MHATQRSRYQITSYPLLSQSELEVTEPISRASTAYNSYSSPRHHLLYCTVCVRSITNVLAQCRFHRISKMTSSNPHPTSPPLSDSLHLPMVSLISHLHLAFPPTCHSNPSTHHLALSSSSTRVRPAPTLYSLTLVLPRPPDRARVILHRPLRPSRNLSYRLLSSLSSSSSSSSPSSISRLSSLTNYRRAQFRWIKAAAAAYYRRSVVPTRRTRIPTNRNANGL